MAVSGVTWSDVQEIAGRPLSPARQAQATRWITSAELLIGAEFDLSALDPAMLAYVVAESVAKRVDAAESGGRESKTVTVDDGSVTDRWTPRTDGRDDWLIRGWRDLLTVVVESGAFSTRPGFEPDCGGWSSVVL